MFICLGSHAGDTVKVLFVYGSKPKIKGEDRWFGGIHGGHVSVQYRNMYASFVPDGKFHVFASRKYVNSKFVLEYDDRFIFDTSDSRYVIICVPVDSMQKARLDSVIGQRLTKSPYDYAFFGMRCASAAYELFATAGIFPSKSRYGMLRKYFYPKKLRKKMFREAKLNNWPVYFRPGRTSRKWEED
jgi:hypothetical protein